MYDIITCGSATIDVFAMTEADLIEINLADLKRELIVYPSGSKIIIKHLEFQTGGGGTNTAVCFSRLGLKTAYLGNVGLDENGNRIINDLKKEKVDFIGTKTKDMTNYSIILDSVKHDRTILAFKGASSKLLYSKIDKKEIEAKWLYSSSLLDKSYDTFQKLIKLAKKRKIKIGFNPSNYQAKLGIKKLKPVLKELELLVFNKEEACCLLGIKDYNDSEIKHIMNKIHKTGPKLIVITDGPKGAYCSDKKHIFKTTPNKVKIIETTGAGDAFASSFVAGLVMYDKDKHKIEKALKLATINASSIVANYGAKNILLKKKQAESLVKKVKPKVRKLVL